MLVGALIGLCGIGQIVVWSLIRSGFLSVTFVVTPGSRKEMKIGRLAIALRL